MKAARKITEQLLLITVEKFCLLKYLRYGVESSWTSGTRMAYGHTDVQYLARSNDYAV